MEPVVNKLQEGVKYPRFERDATRIINDLVTHVTKERGIYSSSIEPNPDEHKIWFNTDTNTLMIYNNYGWRNFNSSNTLDKIKVISNPDKEMIDNRTTRINIKENAFYILRDPFKDLLQIYDADKYDFWLYIENMPKSLHFVNSSVVTNYDTLLRHTINNNIDNMTVLAHKIGSVVEFTVINDKTKFLSGSVYTSKRGTGVLVFVGTNGSMYCISRSGDNINNLYQIEIDDKDFTTHPNYHYDKSIIFPKCTVQLQYPPFHFPMEHISVIQGASNSGLTVLTYPKSLVISDLSTDYDNSNPLSLKNGEGEFIVEKDWKAFYGQYPMIPKLLVLNSNTKFLDGLEGGIIRFPIRNLINNDTTLILKKPCKFGGLKCDENLDVYEHPNYNRLIIEDFGATDDDGMGYIANFGQFYADNVYLMGGSPYGILINIYRDEIIPGNALIYGSNYSSNDFTFERDGSGIDNIVIACKLTENINIVGNTLEDNIRIFTLKENIDILKNKGVNPSEFIELNVISEKDDDGFIISEKYNLAKYGIHNYVRFNVPLVSY